MADLFDILLAKNLAGGGGGGSAIAYTSIVDNGDNTITATDDKGVEHTISYVVGADGKITSVTLDGKTQSVIYEGDVLTKIGNTDVDIESVPIVETGLLPAEYQEVEYIESTGMQYIITDVPQNLINETTIYGRFTTTSGIQLMGNYSYYTEPDGNYTYTSQWFGSFDNLFNFATGGFGDWYGNYASDTEAHRFVTNELSSWGMVDNTYVPQTRYRAKRPTTTTPYYLFARYNHEIESVEYYSSFVFKRGHFLSNTFEKIADFIPCYRKSDNVIGLYNTITETFLTNSGTGIFLKGADVNE